MQRTTLEEKLSTVRFKVDREPHITVDSTVCKDCILRACLTVCPASLFELLSDGSIGFNHDECLECGACYLVCNEEGAISWSHPRGGFGVAFRSA